MSNVKRKDSKNRNLRNGESQRKDGRYVYKYTDIYGKPQFIYSWKLVPTDKTPAGKRDDISLPLWKRIRITASIMMRLCFCWKRDFVFLNFAD